MTTKSTDTTAESNGDHTTSSTCRAPIKPPSYHIEGPDGMITGWLEITQEMAYHCLAMNTANRKMRKNILVGYKRDMVADHWYPHHQGIAFDVDGTIADGQHRLEAIFETGKAQWLMVTWNLPKVAKLIIDNQFVRTALDALHLSGKAGSTASSHIACARRMAKGITNSGAVATLTKKELEDYLLVYQDGIEFAVSCFPEYKRGVTQAGVTAVIAKAYYTVDAEKLKRFTAILLNGMINPDDGKGATTIIKLRDALTRSTNKLPPDIVYAKTARTLRAFIDNQTLKNIYAAEGELFPLPPPGDTLLPPSGDSYS